MDPIRTAVKYSLIPLRTVVQLGDLYVESGRETEPPPEPPKAAKRRPARKRPSPQATQTPKDLDDVALARKVETIIFRDDDVPKGKIDVNAADGVVWLRGEAKTPEMIKTLQAQAAAIPEVKKVENLLHLPKTPARRSSAARKPAARNVRTRQTNERRSATGEDSPVEAAHEGEGRKPAPLGSNGASS
jgi:BON domain